jgi:flagellar basal-body rod protein FlgB
MTQTESQLHNGQVSRNVHPNDPFPVLYRVPSQGSVDNNTVDMDIERAAFADTAVRYQFAIQKVSDEYREMQKLLTSLPY